MKTLQSNKLIRRQIHLFSTTETEGREYLVIEKYRNNSNVNLHSTFLMKLTTYIPCARLHRTVTLIETKITVRWALHLYSQTLVGQRNAKWPLSGAQHIYTYHKPVTETNIDTLLGHLYKTG